MADESERKTRIPGLLLRWSASIAIAAALLLYAPRYLLQILSVITIGFIILFAIVSVAKALIQAQSRVGEWLATIFFAGGLMAAGRAALPRDVGDLTVPALISAGAALWALCGSAWGWTASRTLKEQRSSRRILLLLSGWLGIPGLLGCVIAPLLTLIVVLQPRINLDREVLLFLWLTIALALPAFIIERRCQKLRKEAIVANRGSSDEFKQSLFGALLMSSPGQILLAPVYWLITPFVLRLTWSMKATPVYEPLDGQALPEQVRNHFQDLEDALSGHGFGARKVFHLTGQADNTTIFLSVMRNEATGDAASSVAVFAVRDGQTLVGIKFHGLGVEFGDGTMLTLTTEESPEIFTGGAYKRTLRCMDVADPARLYDIHCARRQHMHLPPKSVEGLDTVAELQRGYLREMQERVAHGYFFLDEKKNAEARYRPSIKGALAISWKSSWPFKQLALARIRRETAEELRKLGFAPDGAPLATAQTQDFTAQNSAS